MTYREIDNVKMSSICMGCWNISGDSVWGAQNELDTSAAIKAALDGGINFFDTAEVYGRGYSEEILGRELSPLRDQVVIASKTSRSEPEKIKQACEKSLQRLKTDYMDLYYIHWPSRSVPFAESAGALLELRQEGKIRIPAVSNFGATDLPEITRHIPIKINQLAYSLLFRAIEHSALAACRQHGATVAAYSPLAEGLLAGKFKHANEVPDGRARTRHFSGDRPRARHGEKGFEEETFRIVGEVKQVADELSLSMAGLSLAWILAQPGVGFVIAGARNARQAAANAKAAGLQLAPEVLHKLDRITSPLKESMGDNPDMWSKKSRIR